METINTIIFDLGEVYLKGFYGLEYILEPILDLNAQDIYPQLRGEDLTNLFQGKITENEYWNRITKKNKWKIQNHVLKKAIRKNFEEIKGVRDIIEILKKKNYKLGLLSVHAKEWVKYLNKKFDYHKLFNAIVYSYQEGACKPDKKVYTTILKKLASLPYECVFIDDKTKNLAPAEKLGIKTIRFENAQQLRKGLGLLGIILK